MHHFIIVYRTSHDMFGISRVGISVRLELRQSLLEPRSSPMAWDQQFRKGKHVAVARAMLSESTSCALCTKVFAIHAWQIFSRPNASQFTFVAVQFTQKTKSVQLARASINDMYGRVWPDLHQFKPRG